MKNYDTVNRDIELRDLFNADDVFELSSDYVDAYRHRLDANLAMWDGLDGRLDWPTSGNSAHPLTELILVDFLVVDVSKPYSPTTFLEIERAALAGRQHTTCDGRSPNDDAMTTLYNFLVGVGSGSPIDDGVHQPAELASDTFPYLVAPTA